MSEDSIPEQGGTRGKILRLLCGGNHTSGDLAGELGISANGVRGHLAQLAAEGLVTHVPVRRGVGKPAHEYRLTAEGSARMSRAYLPLLAGMLAAVTERSGEGETDTLLREAGRGIARRHPRPRGSAAERVRAAVTLLESLGAVCDLRDDGAEMTIQGSCCPLRSLVVDQPLACRAVEAMLQEHVGLPVREECQKRDPPGCRLVVTVSAR